MTDVTFFRVISLAAVMAIVGLGWFFIKSGSSSSDQDQTQLKKQAKKEAIKYSVTTGIIYMVVVLGAANL